MSLVSSKISIKSNYVDLGLPSGTLWCSHNLGSINEDEYSTFYPFKDIEEYVSELPSKEQLKELRDNTKYEFTKINNILGAKFTANNGEYIFFPVDSPDASKVHIWSKSNGIKIKSSVYMYCFFGGAFFGEYDRNVLKCSVKTVI